MIPTTPAFTGTQEGPFTGVSILDGVIPAGDSDIPTDGLITATPTIPTTGAGITTDTMIRGTHPGTHPGTTGDTTGTIPTGDLTGAGIIQGITMDFTTGTDHPAATCTADWITGIITDIPGDRMPGTEGQKVPHTLIPSTGVALSPPVPPGLPGSPHQ